MTARYLKVGVKNSNIKYHEQKIVNRNLDAYTISTYGIKRLFYTTKNKLYENFH